MRDYVINSNLINEWDWKKNNELGLYPDKITLGSSKKVWWICKYCGHEWLAVVCDRSHGRGCPECAKRYQKSSQEMKLYYYIKQCFPNAISGYTDKEHDITEIDVYIPDANIGVEYDGANWHKNIEKDLNKDYACKQHGIYLIRIREPKCPKYDNSCTFIYLKDLSRNALVEAISSVLMILQVNNINVDFDRDLRDIENLVTYNRIENSLAVQNPDIALEWHPIKNGNLKPENILPRSKKRVWWICSKCGYEYITTVSNRVDKHSGCSKCARNYAKQVYCPELDMEFLSIGEAERETGVFHGHISKCINGELKHAGRHPITGQRLTWIEKNIN